MKVKGLCRKTSCSWQVSAPVSPGEACCSAGKFSGLGLKKLYFRATATRLLPEALFLKAALAIATFNRPWRSKQFQANAAFGFSALIGSKANPPQPLHEETPLEPNASSDGSECQSSKLPIAPYIEDNLGDPDCLKRDAFRASARGRAFPDRYEQSHPALFPGFYMYPRAAPRSPVIRRHHRVFESRE